MRCEINIWASELVLFLLFLACSVNLPGSLLPHLYHALLSARHTFYCAGNCSGLPTGLFHLPGPLQSLLHRAVRVNF